MVEVWLPYGNTEVSARISDENLLEIINIGEKKGVVNSLKEVEDALENPIESSKLNKKVISGEQVAIVINCTKGTHHNSLILSCILKKLKQTGIRDEDITVILGCGTYPITEKEYLTIIGEHNKRKIKIEIHDAYAKDLKYVGKTSFGTKVFINATFMDADVKILTGEIGLHCFAGYTGGRDSIIPAIVGIDTIKHNHALLLHPMARTGNLDRNPVHMDMEEALKLVDIDFTLNIVLNSRKEIVKAFAGDVYKVFFEGVKLLDEIVKVSIKSIVDIAIVSAGGFPFDKNLYEALSGINSIHNIIKNNGVLILVAECLEGYSNKIFYNWMLKFNSLSSIKKEIKKKFNMGGHKAYFLLKAFEKFTIILVSVMPNYYATGVFKMRTAKTVNSALKLAFRFTGKKGKVSVIPHGAFTVPIIKKV